jgi:hypothetical protein
MNAAAQILNPNIKAIHDTQSVVDQTETGIKCAHSVVLGISKPIFMLIFIFIFREIRGHLARFLEIGGGYIDGESEVKHTTLTSEQHLILALDTVTATQDALLENNRQVWSI